MSYPEESSIVKSIYICEQAGQPMVSVSQVHALAGQGLEGDRYCEKIGFWQTVSRPKNNIREVTLINELDIHGSGFTEAETRRNIVVTGRSDLISLIGCTFRLGEVLLEGTEECTPCKRPSDLSGKPNFAMAFKTTGGIRARILSTGRIKVGDSLE